MLGLQFFQEDLLHGGRPGMEPPSYVDPYELLRAESSMPMIPFDNNLREEEADESEASASAEGATSQ